MAAIPTTEVIIGKVDCTEERDLCSREAVMGFPTLKLYKSRESNGIEYEGERNLLSLETYLRTQLGDTAVDGTEELPSSEESSTEEAIDSPKPINGLYELNDENIDEFVSKGTNGFEFVLFLILILNNRSPFRKVLRPLVWPLPAFGPHLGSIGGNVSIRHFCEDIENRLYDKSFQL